MSVCSVLSVGVEQVSYFLEVPLAEGEAMLVEVTDQLDEVVPAGRTRDVVGRLPETLTAGLDRVRSFSGEVLSRMRAGTQSPDVVAVEFGLKLTAKTGVVVAESSAEAHVKITVEWRRPMPGSDPAQ